MPTSEQRPDGTVVKALARAHRRQAVRGGPVRSVRELADKERAGLSYIGRILRLTLVVRIPMRFQRRGGRKRIVAPDRSELAP